MLSETERALEWTKKTPAVLEAELARSASDLPLEVYAASLRSFYNRVLKMPEVKVRPLLETRIPFETHQVTLGAILSAPRAQVLEALDSECEKKN